jgi:hypothetical protein
MGQGFFAVMDHEMMESTIESREDPKRSIVVFIILVDHTVSEVAIVTYPVFQLIVIMKG